MNIRARHFSGSSEFIECGGISYKKRTYLLDSFIVYQKVIHEIIRKIFTLIHESTGSWHTFVHRNLIKEHLYIMSREHFL